MKLLEEFPPKISKYLISRTLFVDNFHCKEKVTEKGIKMFPAYCFIFNLKKKKNESKDKRKSTLWSQYALKEQNRRIQCLLKVKTQLVSFVFGFRYQLSGKNKSLWSEAGLSFKSASHTIINLAVFVVVIFTHFILNWFLRYFFRCH